MLGKGGFGITYLARDKNLDKAVAIKEFLPTEFATRDPDLTVHPDSAQNQELFRWGLTRFIEEARVLSRFEHPNIVRVFTVFEENNTGYMVMAYEQGRSLKALLNAEGTLSQERLLSVLMPILDGLQRVHAKQFIHRDIKPDNIYLRDDGTPVLLDFGSARQAIEGESRTMTTMVSPGYAPFEQYHAKGEEQGPWTDIYSLGATAFRAISGINPVDAVTRSRALLEGKPDPQPLLQPQQYPDYAPALLAAVNHALCFRMADRPQNLEQWRQEMQAGDDATVMVDHGLRSAPTALASSHSAGNSRPLRPVPWVAGALLVCALAGLGYYQWSSPEGRDAATAGSVVNNPVQVESGQTESGRTEPGPGEALLIPEPHQQQALQKSEPQAKAEKEAAERLTEEAREQAELRQAEAERKAQEARQAEAARQVELKRQQELEARIAQSKAEFAKRQGNKFDPYSSNDYPVAKPLTGSTTIKVPASTKAWTSSGVLIERGKTYSISAHGQWSVGKSCKSTDASGEGVYTLACWDLGGQVVAGFSHSALVGKIGKGTLPFFVGNRFTFTAEQDGGLYFMVNDAAATFNDNSGALDVTITYQH